MEPIDLLALTALVVALAVVVAALVRTWVWLAGPRVVVCPETRRPAGVTLDVRYGVAGAVTGSPSLRLASCSRWPERQHCGQECLAQIEEAPEDCRVRSRLARWYEGKSCAVCAEPFARVAWHDDPPAILPPEGPSIEWADLRPEQVPDALATGRPVCWSCHMAARFRREHPDLVIERPHPNPRG